MIWGVIGKVPVQRRLTSINYDDLGAFQLHRNMGKVPVHSCWSARARGYQPYVDIMDDFSKLQHIQTKHLVSHLDVGQIQKQEPVKKGWLKPRMTYGTSVISEVCSCDPVSIQKKCPFDHTIRTKLTPRSQGTCNILQRHWLQVLCHHRTLWPDAVIICHLASPKYLF